MIGLKIRYTTGGPYTNDDVSSVMPEIFQTMRLDTLTCTVHNKMWEAERYMDAGVRESNLQCLRSGLGEGRTCHLPSRVLYQTYDLGGDLHIEARYKAISLVG